MAKKAVASLQRGEGRSFAKVIKMVKSPKTGAYIFQEEIVHNDKVKDFFAKQFTSLIFSYKESLHVKMRGFFLLKAKKKDLIL